MTNFAIWQGNHSEIGQISIEDPLSIISAQLRALGHQAIHSKDRFISAAVGYNLIVEGFNDEVTAALAVKHAQGARFICLAMEEPTDKGFNHGIHPEFVARQAAFAAAGPYLSGILHLVPGDDVTNWYAQYAPAAPIELGYAPGLLRRQYVTEPTFDFGFFGSMSERRLKLLRALYKVGPVKVVAGMETVHNRDVFMQDTKVIVQIRNYDHLGVVSSSRCNTALCIGRPVVAEPHALSSPWDQVIEFAESEDEFFTLAASARDDWRGLWAQQFENFKLAFTPERCLGRGLKAIGCA